MKKNSKGFFLAETIIVLALVTTAIAFVLPNVTKIYENYKNTSKYYDQTKDLYALKAISLAAATEINNLTMKDGKLGCNQISNIDHITLTTPSAISAAQTLKIDSLYISDYLGNPRDSSDPEFNKYLTRIKKTSYDKNSYRLIGKFKETIDGKTIYRYASIKYQNPGSGNCTP